MTENLLSQLVNRFMTFLSIGHDYLRDHVFFAKDLSDLTMIDKSFLYRPGKISLHQLNLSLGTPKKVIVDIRIMCDFEGCLFVILFPKNDWVYPILPPSTAVYTILALLYEIQFFAHPRIKF